MLKLPHCKQSCKQKMHDLDGPAGDDVCNDDDGDDDDDDDDQHKDLE